MKLDDGKLKGKKFGRLTLLYRVGKSKRGKAIFKFECDCGNIKDIIYAGVRDGSTKSCGCYRKEMAAKRIKTHDMVRTPEYTTWKNIKARCYNKNGKYYKYYGGRNIKVCGEWRNSFINFYKDMGPRPNRDYSIERIDNNGNYEPSNCKWATQKEQGRNKRNNHMITYNNKTQCLAAWAEIVGINKYVLYERINKSGWSIKRALETPVREKYSQLPIS